MKKKFLILLLVVLTLTFVVQVAMISHPQTVDAKAIPKQCCKSCYWMCDALGGCVWWCFTYCGSECNAQDQAVQ